MQQIPGYITLPGIEVYLVECFFHSQKDRPRRFHTHPAYELVCIRDGDRTAFQITAPLVEHIAADALPEQVCSFLFSFTQLPGDDICQVLKNIRTSVTIDDDFHGRMRIDSIKNLAENITQPGTMEQLAAELRLLFICISRKLHRPIHRSMHRPHTLDQSRLAILEDYFNVGLNNPDCSKRQLASLLGVSERQLTRILEDIYHSTYSTILMRSRMSIACAMAEEGCKTADEIAAAVGYRSAEALRRAYRNFFGEPLKIQNRT